MANVERMREVFNAPPDPEYLRQRESAGWRVGAIEWIRETAGEPGSPQAEDLPYGVRVGPDCMHLEEDPAEREALLLMIEMIIQDIRLTQVAAELNRRGFRMRSGAEWSPVAVFNLLPRLIEMGPRIFSTEEWKLRRPRIVQAG